MVEAGCIGLHCRASVHPTRHSARVCCSARQQKALCAVAQQPPHLHFAAVPRHHALQYACSPARRRPEVHVRARRHVRHSVTRLECKPEHEARALRWQKLDSCAVDGWRGLLGWGACRVSLTSTPAASAKSRNIRHHARLLEAEPSHLRPLWSRTPGLSMRTVFVSTTLLSAGSRRLAVAGSRACVPAALASAQIAGARSEREHGEKGLGRDILRLSLSRRSLTAAVSAGQHFVF